MSRSVKKQATEVVAEVPADEVEEEDAAQPEVQPFEEVERLQEAGINVADINKLKAAGIHTIQMVFMTTKKGLASIKGLSEGKVEKILEACTKFENFGFISGVDALLKRKQVVKITTGCKALDELLGGGIESRSITEVFGEYRTGKTQLCHTLCVASQMPLSQGGGNGKVAYIDTEGTFRPERIQPIADRFGLDADAVLDNVIVARVYTSEQQFDILTQVAGRFAEDQFRLLIIDSIIALFRVDFCGRGELSERQQRLGQMLSRLIKIAEEFNVAVFITNQVMSDPGAMSFGGVEPRKPVGGHVLAHASTTRLMLRKGRGEQRIAKIFDSPSLPEAEAVFQISNQGIVDAKD